MPENNQRIRQTAYKLPINAIINSVYVKESEEWAPNYIKVGDKKVSRVNIIAFVVSVNEEGNLSLVIDDGTAKISVRGFEQQPNLGVAVGDIVNIIGRPREFGNEKYIVPEIIKKTTQTWMLLRKLETKDFVAAMPAEKEEVIEEAEEIEGTVLSAHEKINHFIREKDTGAGVEIDEIAKQLNEPGCEKIIEGMLKEGDIFENMPGRVKILE